MGLSVNRLQDTHGYKDYKSHKAIADKSHDVSFGRPKGYPSHAELNWHNYNALQVLPEAKKPQIPLGEVRRLDLLA